MSSTDESRVHLDDLTHAAFSGVLRALEERKLEPSRWPGPILVGIIAWPELRGQGGVALPQNIAAERTEMG